MPARNDAAAVAPAPRRPGRPPGGQPAVDRAQLLAAAERVIRAVGPDATLEAIAAEAAVTKPTLYREVGDKDALVQALAERFVDRIIGAVGDAVARATEPRAQLRALVAAYLDVVERDRPLYLYVTAGGSSDDRLRQALHLADRSASPIAEQLSAQRAAAGADPSVAVVWSYGLIGMLHYVTLWWLREPVVDRDRLADQVTELMWSGLGGDAAAPPRRRSWSGVSTRSRGAR